MELPLATLVMVVGGVVGRPGPSEAQPRAMSGKARRGRQPPRRKERIDIGDLVGWVRDVGDTDRGARRIGPTDAPASRGHLTPPVGDGVERLSQGGGALAP
ncbi:MAG: hypothetical protein U1F43_24400 [Myxococcota bacterium]